MKTTKNKTNSTTKYLCLTLAAISSLSTAACGNSATTGPDTTVYASAEPEPTSEKSSGAEKKITVAERYPDAEYIEMIAENRYIVQNNDVNDHKTYIRVFDSENNTVVNSITVDNQNTYMIRPYIINGCGFGIVTENSTINSNVKAYFYDTDGNLVNSFFKNLENHEAFNSSYAFAHDGSAFYVTSTDRDQCTCGYTRNDDYTTQVYIVHNTSDYELLSEFDSHTDVELYGTTEDGKLIFSYHHDTGERDTWITHDDFEKNPGDPYMQFREQNGFGFIDSTESETDTPELVHLFEGDDYYDQVYIRRNSVIFANNDEIVRMDPDDYCGHVYDIPGGLTGYNDDIYLSYDGDYIVFPIYKNQFQDTELHVLKYDGNSYTEIFEQEYNYKIMFRPDEDEIAFLDVTNGILYGYIDNAQPGNQPVEILQFTLDLSDL